VTKFHKPYWPKDPIDPKAPKSSILNQAQLEALWGLLPPMMETGTPQVLYDNTQHGYALTRMFSRLQLAHGEMLNQPEIE